MLDNLFDKIEPFVRFFCWVVLWVIIMLLNLLGWHIGENLYTEYKRQVMCEEAGGTYIDAKLLDKGMCIPKRAIESVAKELAT
jgi:hypothetical protein